MGRVLLVKRQAAAVALSVLVAAAPGLRRPEPGRRDKVTMVARGPPVHRHMGRVAVVAQAVWAASPPERCLVPVEPVSISRRSRFGATRTTWVILAVAAAGLSGVPAEIPEEAVLAGGVVAALAETLRVLAVNPIPAVVAGEPIIMVGAM